MPQQNREKQPDPAQWEVRHVVVNLDRELVCQALCESLTLLQQLQKALPKGSPAYNLCSQVRLRSSYAVLHSELPEFKAHQVRQLGLFHHQLATSLLKSERQLLQLRQSCPS